MEKILFDGTYYQGSSRFHGGGEYGNTVLHAVLDRGASKGCGFFYREKYGIDEDIRGELISAGWKLHPMDMMREVPYIVRDNGYTTIYSALPYANNWHWFKGMDDIRFVGTFHGLRSMELCFYEDFDRVYFDNQGAKVLSSSKNGRISGIREGYKQSLFSFKDTRIITVSEHSKHSILYYFPELDRERISVFYSPEKKAGNTLNADNEKKLYRKLGIEPGKFAFMTSANFWYKNAKRAVMAFDSVFSNNYSFIPEDYKFLVIGDTTEKDRILSGVSNTERFIYSEYLEVDELETFYKNAHLFMYPSLNEGFGYPPIEAMKYGTPCVCSVNTSIQEICRDMVWYFNPVDIDEMAIRILQAFSDNEREKKKKRMQEVLPEINKKQREDLDKLVELIVEK